MKKIQVELLPIKTPKVEISRPRETQLFEIKRTSGWKPISGYIKNCIDRVVYLGSCDIDGDCFAIYWSGNISFCKGKLNEGFINTSPHFS